VFLAVPEMLSRTRPLDPVETLAPLEDPPLRDALDAVSRRAGMTLDYYVVDQSKRSRRMNMYVTGRMGREYVVLTDTLANGLAPAEAAAVMAHELLHQQRRTVTMLRGKALALATTLLVFWLAHRREGGGAVPPHRRLQVLVWLVLSATLVGFVARPIGCRLNRTEERAADAFALELTRDPRAMEGALRKVAQANLTPYDVPRWAYLLGASHPTFRERLAAIHAWTNPSHTPASRP
jgi:STE24 endopeptidase